MFQLICNYKLYAIMQCCIRLEHWFAELIGFRNNLLLNFFKKVLILFVHNTLYSLLRIDQLVGL